MRSASSTALLVLALALVPGACGDDTSVDAADPTTTLAADAGGGPGSTVPAPPPGAVDHTGEAAVTVAVTDNVFTDQHIVVSAGTTVTWSNDGRNDHNVTPDVDGTFEPVATSALGPGATASISFDTPGVYAYHCSLHGAPGRAQYGTIVVEPA